MSTASNIVGVLNVHASHRNQYSTKTVRSLVTFNSKVLGSIGFGILRFRRPVRIGVLRVHGNHRNWNSKDDQIPRDWNSRGARDPSELGF